MEKKFTFQGHTFDEEKQVILAKKEAEAIEYLRSKTDFNNLNQLIKLYNRILDKNMMETVIGIEFLNEIRSILLKSGMFEEEQIRPVPLLPEARKMKKRVEEQKRSRERILLEYAERQNLILKIACFLLSVLVIAMFVITLQGKRSPLAIKYEEQILNKYAAWAEELTQRERAIRAYITQLKEAGIEVPDWIAGEMPEEKTETSDGDGSEEANGITP